MLDTIINYLAENPRILVGNIFGLLATVFSFITFQMKTPKKLMFMNSCVIVAVVISYAILGAWSGAVVNIMCLGRNISYALNKKKPFSYKWWPYAMTLIVGATGLLTWQGPVSLLVIIPLMVNTLFMSFNDNQKLRASAIFTSSSIICYNLQFNAYLATLMESTVIVSSIIGLIRYRKKKD